MREWLISRDSSVDHCGNAAHDSRSSSSSRPFVKPEPIPCTIAKSEPNDTIRLPNNSNEVIEILDGDEEEVPRHAEQKLGKGRKGKEKVKQEESRHVLCPFTSF